MTSDDRTRDAIINAAIEHARVALGVLRDLALTGAGSREVSIAITHLEDAILRLEHGSPPDQP